MSEIVFILIYGLLIGAIIGYEICDERYRRRLDKGGGDE